IAITAAQCDRILGPLDYHGGTGKTIGRAIVPKPRASSKLPTDQQMTLISGSERTVAMILTRIRMAIVSIHWTR
uniref:hypothetical protein n=1 Tax=Reinekea sp. TaxID=1970455 RepID=UPI002A80570D